MIDTPTKLMWASESQHKMFGSCTIVFEPSGFDQHKNGWRTFAVKARYKAQSNEPLKSTARAMCTALPNILRNQITATAAANIAGYINKTAPKIAPAWVEESTQPRFNIWKSKFKKLIARNNQLKGRGNTKPIAANELNAWMPHTVWPATSTVVIVPALVWDLSTTKKRLPKMIAAVAAHKKRIGTTESPTVHSLHMPECQGV
mmetsp:Transcript_53507/g.155572  ORF Transcript_53507/g.155572 Transcript_53507/m.155572 type:complete len:203 (-) Transcript_53507:138-746(-)